MVIWLRDKKWTSFIFASSFKFSKQGPKGASKETGSVEINKNT